MCILTGKCKWSCDPSCPMVLSLNLILSYLILQTIDFSVVCCVETADCIQVMFILLNCDYDLD